MSVYGTKRTNRDGHRETVFGGKANIARTCRTTVCLSNAAEKFDNVRAQIRVGIARSHRRKEYGEL
jgi:hypothetical protein